MLASILDRGSAGVGSGAFEEWRVILGRALERLDQLDGSADRENEIIELLQEEAALAGRSLAAEIGEGSRGKLRRRLIVGTAGALAGSVGGPVTALGGSLMSLAATEGADALAGVISERKGAAARASQLRHFAMFERGGPPSVALNGRRHGRHGPEHPA